MAKVLIIEDNDMLNQAYTFMLKAKGYTVNSAFNGREGLEKAEEFEPDVILLDYLMPIMDGKEFLEKFDAKTTKPDVKILLLTNLDEQEKIKEVMALGVHQHLIKAATEPAKLISAVAELAA